MKGKLEKNSRLGEAIYRWWEKLDNNRGSRAQLRRCSTITEVVLEPTFQRLLRVLQQAGWKEEWKGENDRLAAAIGLIVCIKEDTDLPVPKSMSMRSEAGDRPKVSEARFVRLLESPDLDALFTGLRRVLPLMNNQVNVLALVNDLIHWGDGVKKEWAYNYDWAQKSEGNV